MIKDLRKRIHDANIELHQIEAKYYGFIHSEIYNKREQKRINSTLKRVNEIICDNQRKVLDFGAGTGNLTGKLLHIGYEVTAIDISAEMCELLKNKYKRYLENKKLRVINSKIEDVSFNKEEFDLITCYSVLHHLPDYVDVIRKLTFFLKTGGVMYLDHEESQLFWDEFQNCSRFKKNVRYVYFRSNRLLNRLITWIRGINIPYISERARLADYWDKKEHHLDYSKIEHIFEEENFRFFMREDYHLHVTWIPNPIFYIYKYVCKPDMSLWIAKK
jgi:ubiquinone/menaquinone biosynthesis C-methylase UbiE